MKIISYGHILRPKQFYKNTLIFVPLFFSITYFEISNLPVVIIGFISLCFISSGIYIINDLKDVQNDLLHPQKKYRPLPSGEISERNALIYALTIFTIFLTISYYLEPLFFIINLCLIISGVSYSIKLKNIFILDIFLISINYVFRSIGGALIIHVDISHWFVIIIFLLALLLALSKRKSEILLLQDTKKMFKKVLERYTIRLIDKTIIIVGVVIFIIYCVYSINGPQEINDPRLLLTTPIIFGILFLFITKTVREGYSGKELNEILIHDKKLLGLISLWVIMIVLLIHTALFELMTNSF